MKKVTIEFTENQDGYFDNSEMKRHIHADDMAHVLYEISQEIFRPARKHGYSDVKLNTLLESHDNVGEVIGLLEEKFYDLLRERSIDLDELWS